MGSSGSVSRKPKDLPKRVSVDIAAVELIENEITCLHNAIQSTDTLDAFTEASYTSTQKTDDDKLHAAINSLGNGTKSDRRSVMDSAGKVVQDVCKYLDTIDEYLDDLRSSVDKFSDAVISRSRTKHADSDREVANQQIHTVDDQILKAKERLRIMKKENGTSETIESLKCQLNALKMIKSDLETQGQDILFQRARYDKAIRAEYQVAEKEDNLKRTDDALKVERKYEPHTDDNNTVSIASGEQVDKSNTSLMKQLKDLRYEHKLAESKLAETMEKVQKVEEKILEERLSHEVEINSLKAMIEKRDEMIALLNYQLASKGDTFRSNASVYLDDKENILEEIRKPNKTVTDSSTMLVPNQCISDVAGNKTDGLNIVDPVSLKRDVHLAFRTSPEEIASSESSDNRGDTVAVSTYDDSENNNNITIKDELNTDSNFLGDPEVNDNVTTPDIYESDHQINTNTNSLIEGSGAPTFNENVLQVQTTVHKKEVETERVEKLNNTERSVKGTEDVISIGEHEKNISTINSESTNLEYVSSAETESDISQMKDSNQDGDKTKAVTASDNQNTIANGDDNPIVNTESNVQKNADLMHDAKIHESNNKTKLDANHTFDTEKETQMQDILVYEEGTVKEIIYKRNDSEIDGNLSYHKGIGAVVRTTSVKFGVDTVQCDIIDEVENEMLPDFVEGERTVSFHMHIQKKYGVDVSLKKDESIKLFIPHRHIHEFEEAILICSVNGDDWESCDLVDDEKPVAVNMGIQMLGTQLKDVTDVKLVVIAREKTVNLIAGENDIAYQSQVDNSVVIKINTDTFKARTEVKLLVHHSHRQQMLSAIEIHHECQHMMSCTASVSLLCEQITKNDLSIIMDLPEETDNECKYTIFSYEDSGWKLADCDWEEDEKRLTVHLLAGARKYRILGVELPSVMSVEERFLAVKTLHDHTSHYTMRLLFRQRDDDPQQAVVICLRSNLVKQGICELESMGYSIGGFPSAQFCLLDGDTLSITFTGNVTARPVNSKKMELTFYSQKEIATKQLLLQAEHIDEGSSGLKMLQGTLNISKMHDETCIMLAENVHLPINQ